MNKNKNYKNIRRTNWSSENRSRRLLPGVIGYWFHYCDVCGEVCRNCFFHRDTAVTLDIHIICGLPIKKNCIEGLGSGGHRNQEIVIEYKLGGMGIKKLVLKDKFAGKENNNLLLKA